MVRAPFAVTLGLLALVACSKTEPEPTPAASASAPLVLARGVRMVRAEKGKDVVTEIREEQGKAKADARDFVVYVGAKWCEPCQYFHKAAANGDLDGSFPDLTVLEFDYDEAQDGLRAAGYVGELIPLFAVPGPDGHALPDKRMEGSVKGPSAVANITPRLKKLLGRN